jgi:hypothetical protein
MPYNGSSDNAPSDTGPFDNAAARDAAPATSQAVAMTAAVASVAAEVAAMRRVLLGSDRTLVDGCMPRLEQAALVFRDAFWGVVQDDAFQKWSGVPSRTKLRRDLVALRGNLAVVAGLAQSGSALYQGLARLLGAAAGGYTPQGDGAPLQPSVSVLVRG